MNIKLLKRLRNRFARMKHPQHFCMKQIAIKTDCGAAMCFIGHILDLEGYKMRLRPSDEVLQECWSSDDPGRSDYAFIRPDGSAVYDPGEEAGYLLKLTEDQYGMFYAIT